MRKLAIFMMITLLLGIGTAAAQVTGDLPNPEYTTLQIINELLRLQGEPTIAALPSPQPFETYAPGHFTVTGYGMQSAIAQQAYTYNVGTPGTNQVDLGAYSINTLGTLLGAGNIPVDPTAEWGLKGVTTHGTFYSQTSLNSDNMVHWKLYCIPPADEFGISIGFAAFEDTPYPSGDFDYNDLVLKIEPNPSAPIPGSLLLLGSGILGMMGIGVRRKSS